MTRAMILGALVAACADDERSDRTESGDVAGADTVASPVERLYAYGLSFGQSRAEIEEALGTPFSMTGADHELPGGVRIGTTTRDDLTSRLGAPENTRSRGDTTILSYVPPGSAAERYVEFHVVGDTLRRVRWIPYVD